MPYNGIPLGELDTRYVNVTGDSMSGGLTITGTLAATTVTGINVTSGADPGHTHTAYVNVTGDTMTGTLEIDVATTTTEALILKTTDDNATKNLAEWQDSSANAMGGIDERGVLFCDLNTVNTNLFIGDNAGKLGATGGLNIGIGYRALFSLTSGVNNTIVGTNAGEDITEGERNVALGKGALQNVTTGSDNFGLGETSGRNITTGNSNVCIGADVFRNATGTTNSNVCIGHNAYRTTSNSIEYSVAIGYNAGNGNDGKRNVFIGSDSGYISGGGSDNVFIGFKSGNVELGSHRLYIANSDTPSPLVYGEFDNRIVRIHGDLTLVDIGSVGAEVLNETDFATDDDWDTVGDFDTTGGDAEYIHSSGAGTLTQTAANMATALVGNTWYALTYTTSGYSNSSFQTYTITTGILDTALTIPLENGTHTIALYTKAVPGDFVISITSNGGCDVTIDDITLKPITGGDLAVLGNITSKGGKVINTTRQTTTYTALVTDDALYCDTDGAAWTLTLPAGVDGQKFMITNCGSSGNDLTVDGNGAEEINGTTTILLTDEDSVIIVFDTTEEWRIF